MTKIVTIRRVSFAGFGNGAPLPRKAEPKGGG